MNFQPPGGSSEGPKSEEKQNARSAARELATMRASMLLSPGGPAVAPRSGGGASTSGRTPLVAWPGAAPTLWSSRRSPARWAGKPATTVAAAEPLGRDRSTFEDSATGSISESEYDPPLNGALRKAVFEPLVPDEETMALVKEMGIK
jgi:hypothetical protein